MQKPTPSIPRSNRVGSSNQPCWFVFLVAFLFSQSGFTQQTGQATPQTEGKEEEKRAALTFERSPGWFSSYSQPFTPQPKLLLRFNAPVRPMKVAQHLSFYDKRGDRRIRAEVTKLESIEESKALQRFEEEKPVFPLEQFVKVTPATPLPVDSEWLLVSRKGLVSKDKKFEMPQDQRDYLGVLQAFKVKSITAETPYDEKRFISIRTTKYELIDSLTPELLTDYISVDPIPDGFALKRV
ncbi:MAG: hypothetical protein HKN23_16870, partial [Verrucomicrobiales bacterium]|nr:hypothetical protein [Verrucomicrobiales bacterium]